MSDHPFHGPPETDEAHNVQDLHAPIMREQVEPRDGFEHVPTWLMLFYGGVLFVGGFYAARYGGDFKPDVYDENNRGGSVKKDDKPQDPLVLGKRLYAGNCQQCHQADGNGAAGQFPPLAGSEWVLGEPAALNRILLHGLQGDVTVKGQKYNGNMPAFGQRFKDDAIAAVLTYVRQEWGNKADAVPAESVAAARKATEKHTQPWTESELKGVKPDAAAKPDEKKDDGKGKGEKK